MAKTLTIDFKEYIDEQNELIISSRRQALKEVFKVMALNMEFKEVIRTLETWFRDEGDGELNSLLIEVYKGLNHQFIDSIEERILQGEQS